MSTIDKAMELMNCFSAQRPEISLSEFRRLVGRDKATTYRHLTSLEVAGLLEKNPDTKRYRIGPAVLRLAHLREATTPRLQAVRALLPALAEATGETAHASILQGGQLVTLAAQESTAHSSRIVVSEDILPLHATGSGLAVLAFAGEELLAQAQKSMASFTEQTLETQEALNAAIARTRQRGFGVAHKSFEDDVHGIGAPVFDDSGRVAGAIAVASLASRVTPELEQIILRALSDTARKITASWGGVIPAELDRLWRALDE